MEIKVLGSTDISPGECQRCMVLTRELSWNWSGTGLGTFNIYINVLDSGVEYPLSNFADHTKLNAAVDMT